MFSVGTGLQVGVTYCFPAVRQPIRHPVATSAPHKAIVAFQVDERRHIVLFKALVDMAEVETRPRNAWHFAPGHINNPGDTCQPHVHDPLLRCGVVPVKREDFDVIRRGWRRRWRWWCGCWRGRGYLCVIGDDGTHFPQARNKLRVV